MRFGTLCSGIGAPECAWQPLGWDPVFASEIDGFPSAVHAHHFPNTPNLGDMTEWRTWNVPAVDVVCAGTPCQSFSIAGLRGGLDDDRGNLSLEFARLCQHLRPRWIVWENVPGVLSSNGGRDFGSILGALAELGYGVAYRILDAQFFGVPQRRRRVFVVGYLGDWRRAAAVLFEREGVRRDSAPSRQERKDTAGSTGDGIARCVTAGESKQQDWETCNFVAHTLGTQYGPVAGSLTARHDSSPCADRGQNIVFHPTQDPISNPDRCHALGANANATAAVAYSIMPMNSGKDYKARPTDVAQPLMAGGPVGGNQGGDYICQQYEHYTHDYCDDRVVNKNAPSPALNCSQHHKVNTSAVRRLTPTECERLQGFPDGWTQIPYRSKPADQCPDGPRYKALGNSMAVPVLEWIGRRLEFVDGIGNGGDRDE